MPCTVIPTEREEDRAELNENAQRLLEWMEWKLGNEQLDATGRLCGLIKTMTNMEFIEFLRQNLEDPEAQELAGWWQKHTDYDRKYGRDSWED